MHQYLLALPTTKTTEKKARERWRTYVTSRYFSPMKGPLCSDRQRRPFLPPRLPLSSTTSSSTLGRTVTLSTRKGKSLQISCLGTTALLKALYPAEDVHGEDVHDITKRALELGRGDAHFRPWVLWTEETKQKLGTDGLACPCAPIQASSSEQVAAVLQVFLLSRPLLLRLTFYQFIF